MNDTDDQKERKPFSEDTTRESVPRPFLPTQHCPVADAIARSDRDALAGALQWVHANAAQLPEMGRRAQSLAAAYSAQVWADRWERMLAEVAVPKA